MRSRIAHRLPRRRWLIIAGAVLLLSVSYLWAGYVLAPRLIRSAASRWAAAHPGLTLTLGAIKVDPIHFTASIHDIELTQRGRPLAAIAALRVGFAPLSVFAHAYRITALDLDRPIVHARIRRRGTINIAALWARSSSTGTHTVMPAVRIDRLDLTGGVIDLTDRRRAPAVRTRLAPVSLQLTNLRTWGGAAGQFTLRAKAQDSGELLWRGQVALAPFASSGSILLRGLAVGLLADFLPQKLILRPAAGHLSLSSRYRVGAGAKGLNVSLSNLQVSAQGLAVGTSALPGVLRVAVMTARGGGVQLAAGGPLRTALASLTLRHASLTGSGPARGQMIQLASLQLTNTRLDAARRHFAAGALVLTGLRLPVTREKNGRLSLLRWLPATPAQGATTTVKWHATLGRLSVNDASVPVDDLAVAPAVRLLIAPLSFTVRSLSEHLSRPVPVSLSARIDRHGSITLAGRIVPASRSGTLKLAMAYVPLAPLSPYLPHTLALAIHSGALRASGRATLSAGTLTGFAGNVDVYNLQLREHHSTSPLLGWQALELHTVRYRPHRLRIRFVRLVAPTGLIEILPNRTLNLAALLPAHATVAPRRTPQPPGPAFSARVRRLLVVDGAITFADESVEPHFRAPVRRLYGMIANLSTARTALASIVLSGEVIDRLSPVKVSGKFNLYGLGRDTDIRAAFKDIELPIFDPYSDRYAGYAIAKGVLTTRFHYRIVNRELYADHHITIRQLEWGGPSASKQRVGWPIELATALLKNSAGVIHINLPVTGSLNDPNFHITSIVWTMLEHLLERVALAPFTLVGQLFAGAQHAQFIDFVPGSATLTPGAVADLSALAHALAARPALQVDIPAGPAGAADAVALENARIDALIMATDRHPHPAGIFTLPIAVRLRRFAALYRQRLGKPPVFPQHLPLPQDFLGAPRPGAKANPRAEKLLHELAEIRWLRGRLQPTVRPTRKTLAALGLARAENIERALLARHPAEAKRVFLTTLAAGKAWKGRIRLQLQLK